MTICSEEPTTVMLTEGLYAHPGQAKTDPEGADTSEGQGELTVEAAREVVNG